jgi:hypothetical protein
MLVSVVDVRKSSSSTCLRIMILGFGVVLYDHRPCVRGSFTLGTGRLVGVDDCWSLFDFVCFEDKPIDWLLGRKPLRRRVAGASVVVVAGRFLKRVSP